MLPVVMCQDLITWQVDIVCPNFEDGIYMCTQAVIKHLTP